MRVISRHQTPSLMSNSVPIIARRCQLASRSTTTNDVCYNADMAGARGVSRVRARMLAQHTAPVA